MIQSKNNRNLKSDHLQLSKPIFVERADGPRKRKPLRLKEYDYTQTGAYFITICTKNREHIFGEIVGGAVRENVFGEIVKSCWQYLPNHYSAIELDEFVVMPNHVHGIIMILPDDNDAAPVGAGLRPAPTTTTTKRYSLSEIVRAFKSFSARQINELRKTIGIPVWQRNYYEHIIRNERALNRIREYIQNNPLQLEMDRENNQHVGTDEFDVWLEQEGKIMPR